MCQITYFFGKRPELSQKKSGTTFFKARYQFFFLEFLDFFWFAISVILKMTILLYFFEKKADFQFFFDNFFLQILSANFFDKFFSKKNFFWMSFWWQCLWGIIFFQKFKKKYVIMPYKTFSSCFLKQLGSFFQKASILTHRFHSY